MVVNQQCLPLYVITAQLFTRMAFAGHHYHQSFVLSPNASNHD
jgi:hypothetical protein